MAKFGEIMRSPFAKIRGQIRCVSPLHDLSYDFCACRACQGGQFIDGVFHTPQNIVPIDVYRRKKSSFYSRPVDRVDYPVVLRRTRFPFSSTA